MSDSFQPYDPYQEPAAAFVDASAASGRPMAKVTRLQYIYAYQYIFESGNWFLNLLMGALAWLSTQVVPVIGPLVYLGYQYEIVDHLHRNRTMPYPDFDFNRFGDYLGRGAPPFVVGLIFGLLMIPLLLVVSFVGITAVPVTAALMSDADVAEPWIAVVSIGLTLLFIALGCLLIIAVSLLTGPMSLRAGLSGNIGEGFNFGFVFDFLRRMWLEMALAYLWLTVVGTLLYFVGLLFFCVGAYPAVAWSHLASAHMNWQLYELYLDRGGMVIPLKERR